MNLVDFNIVFDLPISRYLEDQKAHLQVERNISGKGGPLEESSIGPSMTNKEHEHSSVLEKSANFLIGN